MYKRFKKFLHRVIGAVVRILAGEPLGEYERIVFDALRKSARQYGQRSIA